MYNYIFYENDTNEVKRSYHDDFLKKKNIVCILNWGMVVSCSRNMNFVKCRVIETSDENFSMFDNFLRIFAHFVLGPFC